MRLEHEELRPKKKELLELARKARHPDFGTFKSKLRELADSIAFQLREHIYKENTILYPAAYKAITDKAEWERIKAKCDELGHCCFTPIA